MSKKVEPTRKERKLVYIKNIAFTKKIRFILTIMGAISLGLSTSSFWWFLALVLVLDFIVMPIVATIILVILCVPTSVEHVEIITEAAEDYSRDNKSWLARRAEKRQAKLIEAARGEVKAATPKEEVVSMPTTNFLGVTTGTMIGRAFEKDFYDEIHYAPSDLTLIFHSISNESDSDAVLGGPDPYIIFNGAKYQN